MMWVICKRKKRKRRKINWKKEEGKVLNIEEDEKRGKEGKRDCEEKAKLEYEAKGIKRV